MLSLLPPLTHKYESHRELGVIDESIKDTNMIDNCLDMKRLLMTILLQNLRHYSGFHIPLVSILPGSRAISCG